MPRNSCIETGSSELKTFFYWIRERHNIWIRRDRGEPREKWTNDEILKVYKFTNAFRQLDRGTVALTEMIAPFVYEMESWEDELVLRTIGSDIIFNIWWYRLFNRWEHARDLGYVPLAESSRVKSYIYDCYKKGEKIFTSAHMTTGVSGEPKHETYLRAVDDAIDNSKALYDWILDNPTMESAFNELCKCYMIGRFVAYEIVCDIRFTPMLEKASDRLTWANVGPGAFRGLKRLGLCDKNNQKAGLEEMIKLYEQAGPNVGARIWKNHMPDENGGYRKYPPFELREIEHSLCEFDKYERVRLGQGTPRERFRPFDQAS